MMYYPHTPILFSEVHETHQQSMFDCVYSNGTYYRLPNGAVVGYDNNEPFRLHFIGEQYGERFSGKVEDEVLSSRVMQYLHEFFGSQHTNCATFAHFLTTGEFCECKREENFITLNHGMRPFEIADDVRVGDTVCILYAWKRLCTSRRTHLRTIYRSIQKRRHTEGGFACAEEFRLHRRVFSPTEIRELYHGLSADDFHFMVCVAKVDGKPVWLSQLGRMEVGGDPVAFALTTGTVDPYLSKVPLAAFIKKAR